MKAEITKRTDTSVTFSIVVDKKELEHAAKHTYDHLRPRVKAAGFRPGKAPNNIVERELGSQTVQSEALEHAVGHTYSDAVLAEKLTVLAQPDVAITKFVPYTDLEYTATVEVMPTVKLGDYKSIKKTAEPVKIEAEQIDQVVEDLRRRLAARVPVSRPAELGDEVKFDFAGSLKGEPVAGATSKNHVLKLGSGSFIPGFEEELVGLKPKDKKTFTVTFPKDYHETNLAGQPVEFQVEMHEVIELALPEVTDKFAAEVGPFQNVKELRTDITGQLKLEAEEVVNREYENELLEEIVSKSKLTIPDVLRKQQLDRLKSEMAQRLKESGLDMDKYLQVQKKTMKEVEAELLPEAERRVSLAMVLGEVAKQEELAVTVEEVDNEIEELRKRYSDSAMQEQLAGDRIREDVYNHLMAGRVIRKLVEFAKSK